MQASEFNFPLLIEAEDLVPYLGNEKLRIIDMCRSSVYEQLHLPHAVHIQPKQVVAQRGEATGVLPEEKQLHDLIAALNISKDHHVVVYDDEGGAWAGRLIWTLHCLGHTKTSLLNGGIHAWLGANYPTTSEIEDIAAVDYLSLDLAQSKKYQIEYNELQNIVERQALASSAHQDQTMNNGQADDLYNEVQFWDCRTAEEYSGQRLAARRGGHIPGARHFEWSTALNRQNHLKLYSLENIKQRLENVGFKLNQPVIVYCQSHHRSGLGYIIGRLLQWDIRAYDGAWSEWGNRLDSSIITGENPF